MKNIFAIKYIGLFFVIALLSCKAPINEDTTPTDKSPVAKEYTFKNLSSYGIDITGARDNFVSEKGKAIGIQDLLYYTGSVYNCQYGRPYGRFNAHRT